jgi:hypothetical protein
MQRDTPPSIYTQIASSLDGVQMPEVVADG